MGKPTKVRLEIVHEPGRCGGDATVGPTRITVRGIIGMLRVYGNDIDAYINSEGNYTREQVQAAIDYYRANPEEIDESGREHNPEWKSMPVKKETLQGTGAWLWRLQQGEIVSFKSKGNSMVPRIKSGEECTYLAILSQEDAPVGATRLTRGDLNKELVGPCYITPDQLRKKDMVWCCVGGRLFTHLVSAIRGEEFQISNNSGHVNGWISRHRLYGLVIKVGG